MCVLLAPFLIGWWLVVLVGIEVVVVVQGSFRPRIGLCRNVSRWRRWQLIVLSHAAADVFVEVGCLLIAHRLIARMPVHFDFTVRGELTVARANHLRLRLTILLALGGSTVGFSEWWALDDVVVPANLTAESVFTLWCGGFNVARQVEHELREPVGPRAGIGFDPLSEEVARVTPGMDGVIQGARHDQIFGTVGATIARVSQHHHKQILVCAILCGSGNDAFAARMGEGEGEGVKVLVEGVYHDEIGGRTRIGFDGAQ